MSAADSPAAPASCPGIRAARPAARASCPAAPAGLLEVAR